MWYFMYACYLLGIASFVMLGLTGASGYWHFSVGHLSHASFALLSMIVFLFAQTLIMFFFVGTGVSVKEYSLEKKSDPSFYARAVTIKNYLYPPMILSIILFSTLFITGGAVDTGKMPGWLHGVLYLLSFGQLGYTMVIEHRAFRENTRMMLELFGIAPAPPDTLTGQ